MIEIDSNKISKEPFQANDILKIKSKSIMLFNLEIRKKKPHNQLVNLIFIVKRHH